MHFVVVRITNGCVNRMKLSEGRAVDMVRCGSMGRVDGMVQESKEVIERIMGGGRTSTRS